MLIRPFFDMLRRFTGCEPLTLSNTWYLPRQSSNRSKGLSCSIFHPAFSGNPLRIVDATAALRVNEAHR